MKRLLSFLGTAVWSLLAMGAGAADLGTTLRVTILPQYDAKDVIFDEMSLTNAAGQKLSVTRLDLLLSNFALHRKNAGWVEKTNWQAFVSCLGKRTSCEVKQLAHGKYDRIRFNVGLPPEINHAKTAQYSSDHPLNPNLNGLYWGWAGGYVFFAIEGHWLNGIENSGYSFHLGNDWMLTTVELPLDLRLESEHPIDLALNLNRLFDQALSPSTSSTHSRAGDELAAHWKKNLSSAFSVAASRPNAKSVTAQKPVNALTAAANTHPYRFTFSAQFPLPELPQDNPLTEEGVELGHRLFGERRLSINNQQSCASCHREENAFSDPDKSFSRGAEGRPGVRNSMSIFNLAWKKTFFWDGRASSVREQVLQPIQNPIEMHERLDRAVTKLAETEFYPAEFRKVFGTPEITAERIAKALEQFVLTRLSYDSKFDHALDGKEELSDEEKRGFQLFITEYDPRREEFGADCFHCHGGPLLQSQSFANNGLDSMFKDAGRYEVTKNNGDKGKFAVPSLRNVELTAPYMHDGRFKTLEEVVEHYATGVKRSETLDPNIAKHPDGGVPLTAADKKALVAFLKTLTDRTYVFQSGRREPRPAPPN